MRVKANNVFKIVGLTIIIALTDVLIRYILMEINILDVRPFSAITGGESHFYNIIKAFIWNIVMIGWAYLVYIIVLAFIFHRFPTSFLWLYVRSLLIYIILSALYVFFSGVNQRSLMIENIVVAVPLTFILTVLYKYWTPVQRDSNDK